MAHEAYLLARFEPLLGDQPLSSRSSTTPPAKTSDSITTARALVLPAPRPKATRRNLFPR
jgi:hypothetical protein